MRWRKQRTPEAETSVRKRMVRREVINLAVDVGVPRAKKYLRTMHVMLDDHGVQDIIRIMIEARDEDE